MTHDESLNDPRREPRRSYTTYEESLERPIKPCEGLKTQGQKPNGAQSELYIKQLQTTKIVVRKYA